MSEGRIATTLVMLAIFSGMSALALGFPSKAAFMPLLIGIPGVVLCLAQLVIDLRGRAGAATAGTVEPPRDKDEAVTRREWFMFLWLGAFTAAVVAFGFHIGGSAVVFLYVRFGEREPWVNAIVAGLATLAVTWLVFTRLLELPLFDGLIVEALTS